MATMMPGMRAAAIRGPGTSPIRLATCHVSVTCHSRGVVTRRGMEDGTSRPLPVGLSKWHTCVCICVLVYVCVSVCACTYSKQRTKMNLLYAFMQMTVR